MLFGLCSAPSVFRRYVNYVFKDLINEVTFLAYLNDLVLPYVSKEGLRKLIKFPKELKRSCGLLFNWKKYQFMKKNKIEIFRICNKTKRIACIKR